MSPLDPSLKVLFQLVTLLGGVTKVLMVLTSLRLIWWVLGFSQRWGFSEEGFMSDSTQDIISLGIEWSIINKLCPRRVIFLVSLKGSLAVRP